ncbi:hypothetical protein T05_3553 [Trichinella murrelli]|uniref:Uncharacterized protein n=1 Tax=Trichinella murrelli TaxID=144512 RepID=A0A0V0SX65_9BILA|nr:hypothetical protein T05_3553 [Trichinella murrelli]
MFFSSESRLNNRLPLPSIPETFYNDYVCMGEGVIGLA